MASLDESYAKYIGKTPEVDRSDQTAAEKKRLAKQRKKSAQKAKKKEKKEATLAAEQSASSARAKEDEYGEYEKSKRKEPLIKKYLTEEDIKNAEDAKLLQKQRTLHLNLGALGDLENMTDDQIDDLGRQHCKRGS